MLCRAAFAQADRPVIGQTLQACTAEPVLPAGLGERGIGGSKCGSTGVVAVAFRDGGKTRLLAANVGDARAVLSRKGKALQLTVDHVPDRSVATQDALHC